MFIFMTQRFMTHRLLVGFLLIGMISIGGCSDSNSGGQNEPASDATSTDQTPGDNGSEPANSQDAGASTDEPSTDGHSADGHSTDASSATSDSHATQNTNRLVDETSPYLRMHAHNPVDWYPWGEEALQKAKDENKVIFLSVGYSSCHWCHVMERESFMDPEIAKFLNDNFVCIKVDREERPDVDSIYMTAVQLLTQRGGWPMSVFMTPDAKPFFGGTYFPPRDGDRPGAVGFLSVLDRVHEIWQTKQDDVKSSAEQITKAIQLEMQGQPAITPITLSADSSGQLIEALTEQYDAQYGGFGYDPTDPARPKFPEPSNLIFLVEQSGADGNSNAQAMLDQTLQRMAMGGIWDHLGGGFHRYSVDRFWEIPHFEKMLYDNGQLLSAYSQAYDLTQNEEYKWVVDETVDHLIRDMRDPGGAFYAAMDADTDNIEGKYYRWTREELQELLGDDFEFFASVYDADGEPNFEEEFYVLQFPRPMKELAAEHELSVTELRERLKPLREKLLKARGERTRPLTDSKLLTSWNGLAIRGLADAGRLCQNPAYTEAGEQAANFLLENLRGENGQLLRTYSQGQATLNAYLDDYAFLIDGLIGLYQATGNEDWLVKANELMEIQIDLFWDETHGSFFYTAKDHEKLIVRSKQMIDSARPSGNSVSAANLLFLGEQLDKPDYLAKARQTAENTARLMSRIPAIAPRMSIVIEELAANSPSQGQDSTDGNEGVPDGGSGDSDESTTDPSATEPSEQEADS